MNRQSNIWKTLKHVHLMLRHDLKNIPSFPLPEGYAFRFGMKRAIFGWERP